MEVDGLFEQFVRNSRHFVVSNRPLFVQEIGISGEIPQTEVYINAGFGSLTERDRDLY